MTVERPRMVRPATSARMAPEHRRELRDSMQADIEAFLQRGGKITEVPIGTSGITGSAYGKPRVIEDE